MRKYAGQMARAPNDNFRENICSEDDLRTRIFGTFVVKFLALTESLVCTTLMGALPYVLLKLVSST